MSSGARANEASAFADAEPFDDALVRASADGQASEIAAPEDVVAFQERFLRLVEKRTAIHTMGDSSSIPKSTAIELMRSVCFVLGIDPEDGVVPERLLTADLEAEFNRGLKEIERKVGVTGELWRAIYLRMPAIDNIGLRDTLAVLGEFPRTYDYRSFAHDCACSFDYQLSLPVSDELLGVDYINEYLRRLLIETDFLAQFDVGTATRLLAASCPDYRGLLINLFEPVAANAIGLALVGKDPHGLRVSDADRAEVARRLGALAHAARVRALREAAQAACDALGIGDEPAREYLAAYAEELLPRIEVGLDRGELVGVFVRF